MHLKKRQYSILETRGASEKEEIYIVFSLGSALVGLTLDLKPGRGNESPMESRMSDLTRDFPTLVRANRSENKS